MTIRQYFRGISVRFVVFSFILGIIFFLPLAFASAQGTGIVPCDGTGTGACQMCDVVKLGQNLLTWAIKISASVIALVFAIGGLYMVTSGGSTEGVSKGKKMMTNSIIGLIILLGAWIMIDTVMKLLLSGNPDIQARLGVWSQIQCVSQPAQTPVAPAGTAPGAVTTGPAAPGAPTTGSLTHQQAVAQLGNIPVVSSGNCTDRSNPSCTSLDGMQADALKEIAGTINACTGCNLQITAGTETGHTNACHQNGTCVDIRCAGGCSSTQIAQVNQSATSNGARVVYETTSCAARDAAKAQGVTAYCQSDPGYGHITGNHFSLYTN